LYYKSLTKKRRTYFKHQAILLPTISGKFNDLEHNENNIEEELDAYTYEQQVESSLKSYSTSSNETINSRIQVIYIDSLKVGFDSLGRVSDGWIRHFGLKVAEPAQKPEDCKKIKINKVFAEQIKKLSTLKIKEHIQGEIVKGYLFPIYIG
jgi:hypothetical protein